MTAAELLKALMDGTAILLSITAMVVAWVRTQRRDSEGATEALELRIDAAETRLATIGARLEATPTSADLSALKVSFAELHGDLKALGRSVDAQTEMMRRLEQALTMQQEHLLKGAGR